MNGKNPTVVVTDEFFRVVCGQSDAAQTIKRQVVALAELRRSKSSTLGHHHRPVRTMLRFREWLLPAGVLLLAAAILRPKGRGCSPSPFVQRALSVFRKRCRPSRKLLSLEEPQA